MVLGQRLQRMRMQSVDTRIAHMQHVHLTPLENQGAEGADISPVFVKAGMAALGLRMQPRIRSTQHPLGRSPHRPGIRGRVIVFQKAVHRRRTGFLADGAGADAIGQRDHNAFAAQKGLARQHRAVKILVHALGTGTRVLAERDTQLFSAHALCIVVPAPSPSHFTVRWGAVL